MIFAAIENGTLQAPAADEVPASVRAALLKGLAAFPKDRHNDVESLLIALRSHRQPTRRRGLIAGSAVALLGLGAAATAVVTPSPEMTEPFDCVDATDLYGEAWSTERRSAVEAAFASKATGQQMFAVLDTELQARRLEWFSGHDAACDARRRDEQTDTTYALRLACLEARQAEADLFSELLTTGDERLLDGAVSSSTTLVPIAACEDIEALQAAPRATPEQAKALIRLRRELTRARILLLAGRHGEVLELMTTQIEGLRKVDFAADLAVGLEIMARAQMQLAQYQDAEANLREALTLAAESRDHGTEARATGTLIFIVGQRQKRYDEALGMLPAGRAAAARSPDPRALSYLEAAIGSLFVSQKRYDEARQSINRVIDTLEGLERPPPDELANAYASRGELKAATGDAQGATEDQVRAVKIVGDGLGERHPFYGAFAMRLGMTHASNGRYDDAVAAYADSLTAWEATYGKDHSSCALAMLYIGIAQRQAGRLEEAAVSFADGIGRNERAPSKDPAGLISLVDNLAYVRLHLGEWDAAWLGYVRARELTIADGGEDDTRVAGYDRALASVLQPQGKYEESLQHLERNRSRLVSEHGPKHPDVARASALIGDTYFMLGDCVTAQRHYGSALRIRSDLELPPDEALAQLLIGSGQCDLAAGDIDAARKSIEHAATLANDSTDQALLARLDFATARLRWRDGQQGSAHRLVLAAVGRLASAGPAYRHRAAPMQAWLDEHAP
ncbi:MAG: tetratricopeptide repeat protein [Nannocystaceae bacterium]|nr:tetratricopeptide repeat protein [Nannocystaceae bacterium]